MCRTITYKDPIGFELQGRSIEYGQGVRVVFNSLYNENQDVLGEEFADNAFEYVNDLGETWQKGHILARRFGGDNRSHNLLPMTQRANLCFRREVEDKLSQILSRLYWLNGVYQMECNFAQIEIVYEVNIGDCDIEINGISIPSSFTARIYARSYSEINYDVINNLLKREDFNMKLPFQLRIETNLA